MSRTKPGHCDTCRIHVWLWRRRAPHQRRSLRVSFCSHHLCGQGENRPGRPSARVRASVSCSTVDQRQSDPTSRRDQAGKSLCSIAGRGHRGDHCRGNASPEPSTNWLKKPHWQRAAGVKSNPDVPLSARPTNQDRRCTMKFGERLHSMRRLLVHSVVWRWQGTLANTHPSNWRQRRRNAALPAAQHSRGRLLMRSFSHDGPAEILVLRRSLACCARRRNRDHGPHPVASLRHQPRARALPLLPWKSKRGNSQAILAVTLDRCSNGPQRLLPQPARTRRKGESEDCGVGQF